MKKELFDSINKELLRECTLESLKVGDLIIWCAEGTFVEYLGPITNGVDYSGDNDIAIRWVEEDGTGVEAGSVCFNKSHRFYHLPLAWLDGNPLYEGDIIYGKHNNEPYTVNKYLKYGKVVNDIILLVPQNADEYDVITYESHANESTDNFSNAFSKEQVKERWIAVMPSGAVAMGTIKNSKEELVDYLCTGFKKEEVSTFELIKLPEVSKENQ